MADAAELVVVVDDDAGVCQSLSRVLLGHGYRVRTYVRAADFLADGDLLEPACILADVRMPGLDGIAMHRASIALGLMTPTVFMTESGDIPTVVAAMREGAVDVLEKPFADDSLLQAVSVAVARAQHERAAHEHVESIWRSVSRLTPREAEVAALVATGRLNKQIAAAIGTSEKTVKVHRARALRKLGVHSVAELVRIIDRALEPQGELAMRPSDVVHPPHPRALDIIAATLDAGLLSPESDPHHSE
jgi:FixJ family two-component response regulator